MENIPVLSDDDFELFQKLLIGESGLFFDKEKIHTLSCAIYERRNERKCDSYIEYYNLIKSQSEGNYEFQKLYNLITIGETYFYRTENHYDTLIKYVLPDIIKRKRFLKNRSIRIWSSGCSKGDEAYSLAIAILENIPEYENWDISILGTDINWNVLNQAKDGIYTKRDVSHIPDGYLEKYFVSEGRDYVLDEKIKKQVKFEYHNLVKDPYSMDEMQDLDIIFCRNVTIYFQIETIKLVVEKFYDCLSDEGYLFIGPSETLWQITNKYKIIEFPNTFLYKKVIRPDAEDAPAPFISIPGIEQADHISEIEEKSEKITVSSEEFDFDLIEKQDNKIQIEKKVNDNYKMALKYFNKNKYADALLILDKIISENKNYNNAYYIKATILANQAKYDDAIKELRKIIENDSLFLNSYYLLGVLLYKTGDFNESETQFRKVIYLNPEVIIAYFNLGNIYMYQKKYTKAEREFKNAVNILEKLRPDDKIRLCEEFTADFLLRTCKNKVLRITDLMRE